MDFTLIERPQVIIWDWNGTLLDDVQICVNSMNILLKERNLKPIDTNLYREVFTFPVRKYYEDLGFDFTNEPFEVPALAFMKLYIEHIFSARLHPDAVDVIKSMQVKGINQYILSAMEQDLLDKMLKHYNISQYFELIFGIEDHLGGGKTHRGLHLLHESNIDPSACLFIGDTLHDQEVAEKMGCKHILVAIGHQSAGRLYQNGNNVLNSLTELKQLL